MPEFEVVLQESYVRNVRIQTTAPDYLAAIERAKDAIVHEAEFGVEPYDAFEEYDLRESAPLRVIGVMEIEDA